MMNGLGHTLRAFAIDLAPMVFFLVLVIVTGNVVMATSIGVGLSLLELAWQLIRRKPIGALQWASLGLMVVSGGATLITHDPRFVMLKPTAVHLVLAATMLKRGWIERYVPENLRDIVRPLLTVFGYVWAGLMAFTALLNLVLVFTVDAQTWAKVNLIFPPTSMIALFVIQNAFMRSRAALAHYNLPEGREA